MKIRQKNDVCFYDPVHFEGLESLSDQNFLVTTGWITHSIDINQWLGSIENVISSIATIFFFKKSDTEP